MSATNPFGENPFKFPRRNPGERRKLGPLGKTLIALVVLAVVLISLSGFYADLLYIPISALDPVY